MKISMLIFISIISFTTSSTHEENSVLDSAFAPSPAPYSVGDLGSPVQVPDPIGKHSWPRDGYDYSPPAPSPSLESPTPSPSTWHNGDADAWSPDTREPGGKNIDDAGPPARSPEPETVRWCAVGEEVEVCRYLAEVLSQSSNYTWNCVRRDTTKDCLDAIKEGEAELISLEAGLAFTAFLNFSLKAIANEVYCNHADSYESVAVVPRRSCKSAKTSLMDFKGARSCHGARSSASGWGYPMDHLKKLLVGDRYPRNDEDVAAGFFSKVCAPSDSGFEAACGVEYYGDRGAFRCLMEGLGDIAFVRGDTPLLYSMEGPYNKSWSTKSIHDFMYLCPEGGCREINGYPGTCSLGIIPGNMIMASNSLPNSKRLTILENLENVSWIQSAYAAKIDSDQLFSPSTQELRRIETLTRAFLGDSASISQSMLQQSTPKSDSMASSSSRQISNLFSALLSALIMFLYYC